MKLTKNEKTKQLFTFFKEYQLYLFVLYSIGFLYHKFFFNLFNIDISKYLTINDLLFYSIDIVIFYIKTFSTALVAYIFLFYIITIFYKPKNTNRIDRIDTFLDILVTLFVFSFNFKNSNEINLEFQFSVYIFFLTKFFIINKHYLRKKSYAFFKINIDKKELKKKEKKDTFVNLLSKKKKLIYNSDHILFDNLSNE